MKSGLYPILNVLVTNIAIIFCIAPFLLVIWKKLQYERAYTLIGIYWLVTGLLNQYNWISDSLNYHLQAQLMFLRNLLGIHFVFVIFMICSKGSKRRTILYGLLLFILFETIMMIWYGFDNNTNIKVVGIGSLLILFYCVLGLIDFIKEVQHSSFENSMAFVYAAFLFAYGGSSLLYLLNYLKIASTTDPDEFFLYYVGLLLSGILTFFGLWQYAESPSHFKSKKIST